VSRRTHGNALPHGYRLHWYRIESVLGQGGFGITYLAHDTNLNKPVAIKEYLPVELAVRETDFTVRPFTEDRRDQYTWGLHRFIEEARTLANFDHPNIVRVHSVFEENATAYMVMAYEVGETLDGLAKFNRLNCESALLAITHPLIDALEYMHAEGFIHRDIKPANIVVRPDGNPVLLDFGSARLALGSETRTLTSVVSAGFAPFEQYQSEGGKQGPWTDLYGLSATLYAVINHGRGPLDAIVRGNARIEGTPDPMESATTIGSGRYSPQLLEAIDAALAFTPVERPQTMAEFRKSVPRADAPVNVAAVVTELAPSAADSVREPASAQQTPPPERKHRSRSRVIWTTIFVLLLAVSGFLWWYQEQIRPFWHGKITKQAQEITNIERIGESVISESEVSITELLEKANKALVEDRIIEPHQNNARDYFRAAAELDPGNSVSIHGLRLIVTQLVGKAELALGTNQFEEAESLLDEADNTISDTSQVRKVRERLAQRKKQRQEEQKTRISAQAESMRLAAEVKARTAAAQAEVEQRNKSEAKEASKRATAELKAEEKKKVEQARREQITTLLTDADSDRKALRLTSPAGANAVEKYREVLALDDGNIEARAGLAAVVDRYVVLASEASKAKHFGKAGVYLDRAMMVLPSAENVQIAIDALVTAQESEKRAKREKEEALKRSAANDRESADTTRHAQDQGINEGAARLAKEQRIERLKKSKTNIPSIAVLPWKTNHRQRFYDSGSFTDINTADTEIFLAGGLTRALQSKDGQKLKPLYSYYPDLLPKTVIPRLRTDVLSEKQLWVDNSWSGKQQLNVEYAAGVANQLEVDAILLGYLKWVGSGAGYCGEISPIQVFLVIGASKIVYESSGYAACDFDDLQREVRKLTEKVLHQFLAPR